MTQIMVDVHCPDCGTLNERRETLAEVVPGCVIAPSEIVWCSFCGREIA